MMQVHFEMPLHGLVAIKRVFRNDDGDRHHITLVFHDAANGKTWEFSAELLKPQWVEV